MGHIVGQTRNGITVNVDLIHSEAAQNIARKPYLIALAGEALSKCTLTSSQLVITCNMGRPIGYDFVVQAVDKESVFYAQQTKHTAYTPFTKKAQPMATNLLTMVMQYSASEGYSLADIWLGAFRPALPSDASGADSRSYWAEHAYVYEDQHIKVNSVTHVCPY